MTPIRLTFTTTARAFEQLVTLIKSEQWDEPGLGEWSVRELVGHTTRAFTTVEDYLCAYTADLPVEVFSAAEYFDKMLNSGDKATVAQSVAQRGREAAVRLGDDPLGAVQLLIDSTLASVNAQPANAAVAPPAGVMTLDDYLVSRIFELTAHGMDIARAIDVALPEEYEAGLRITADVCIGLAHASNQLDTVIGAMLGRHSLAAGFSLI